MGQQFSAVNTSPGERIVGEAIVLAPADFGGKEIFDAALDSNLGQGPGVTKHIRHPKQLAVLAEFLLNIPSTQ